MSRQCFFRCILDSHAPIKLLHGVETIVGRSKITKIKDQSCSRQQISLKADCEQCIVEIKQIGINPSGLDGFALKRDKVYKVKHGSRVEVLLNNYFHIMEFDPPPNEAGTKRKSEEEQTSPRKKISLNTEMEGVSSSIKEASENVWENIDKDELYVYTTKGVKSRAKIAAFDMDGTLIKPKSGRVFPVNLNDWQIIFPQVAPKLKECIENDFKLVILSNQAPIGNGRVKIEDFMKKIEKIVETLNVPIQVYIATGNSLYRKPRTGMWRILTEQKNDGLEIDMAESFYCGDAAGRLANWAPGKKKDHSMVDKLMAENIGLKFYTPEQYFLGHSISNVPMAKPEFNPKDVMPEPFNDNIIRDEQEILVLVGYPGSGKSFLSSQIEKKSDHRYRAVCRDYMGTWQKCATEAKKLLQQGRSVVIDSTNPDVESRGRWVWLAKEMRVQVRCAKLTATKPHAQHNNKFRQLMKIDHLHVSEIIYHTYKNKYVEPALTEGFSEIIEVNFNPTFDDKEAEAIYNMYLLDK